jgi:ABC-type phosphate transport system auxiliary subunit
VKSAPQAAIEVERSVRAQLYGERAEMAATGARAL